MKFDEIIRKISSAVAAVAVYLIAAGFYLGAKGFGFDANGNLTLIKPAAAAETSHELDPNVVIPGGRSLGSMSAPVVIYEYSSLGCYHCAGFHEETLPRLTKEYIDKGLVRLVFSSFPLDKGSLKAAMLASCAPSGKYFDFINLLFQKQREWGLALNTEKTLAKYAKLYGISEEKAFACMNDKKLAQELVDRRQRAIRTINIQGTPTFVIANRNSREVVYGELDFDEIKPLIDKKL